MKNHTTTIIRIDPDKLKELKRRALEENRSLASLLREIIDDYLEDSARRLSRDCG